VCRAARSGQRTTEYGGDLSACTLRQAAASRSRTAVTAQFAKRCPEYRLDAFFVFQHTHWGVGEVGSGGCPCLTDRVQGDPVA
jgi:hypothetical protein